MDTAADAPNETQWFVEAGGQRTGPFPESQMIGLIRNAQLSYGTAVWRKGFADWTLIEQTELATHLNALAPPPLSGNRISNTVVWFLAFAPLIGLFLETVIADAMYPFERKLNPNAHANDFWFVTVLLNVGLSFLDERRLRKAGCNTQQFKGWVWLVPVYLYQRAKAAKQNLAYFIVWLVCFAISLAN